MLDNGSFKSNTHHDDLGNCFVGWMVVAEAACSVDLDAGKSVDEPQRRSCSTSNFVVGVVPRFVDVRQIVDD